MALPSVDLLVAAVQAVAPAGADWLRGVLAAPFGHPAFAAAGRKLGTAAVGDAARTFGWPPSVGADECGRAAMLLAASNPVAPQLVGLVADLYRRGDARERQAILRVLAALPEPQRFVELAVDACRTNVATVFEAIACDNPFAANFFPEAAFNQMVLKALFVSAPVGRIVGLPDRITPELIRMVAAFASERRAAGRPVPADVALIAREELR